MISIKTPGPKPAPRSLKPVPGKFSALRATSGNLCAALMVAGLLGISCGDSSAGGGGEKPVTIEVMLTRPYYMPTGFAEAMLEKHNIDLVVDIQSDDDILQQLRARIADGEPLPDLLGAEDSFLIPAFAASGILAESSAFREQFQVQAPETYDQLWDIVWTETDGIGASITANFDVLFFNAQWYKKG